MHLIKLCYFSKGITLAVLASLLAISGCAFHKPDPYERLNRGIFLVNRTADRLFIKPAAMAYDKFLPKPFRYAVNSFFQNLREIPTCINDLLQLKFKEARTSAARFALNTSWGVLGLIDVATLGKIEKHSNDFGLTMAHYGCKESVYLMLPIFGPSTLRDALGLLVDSYISVWPYIRPATAGWVLYGISMIDTRAKLLQAEPIMQEAAVDEYTFIREAYLQHRCYLMNINKAAIVGEGALDEDLPDDNEALDEEALESDDLVEGYDSADDLLEQDSVSQLTIGNIHNVAPCTIPRMILSVDFNLGTNEPIILIDSEKTIPENPEEIKGISTMTDAPESDLTEGH